MSGSSKSGSERYFEGVVDKWCGDGQNFGFITYRRDGRDCRIFFPNASIRRDNVGRTSQCWLEQTLVRFQIKDVVHKSDSRTIAVDVHPVFQEEAIAFPEAHREVSRVVEICRSKNSCWVQRESGEKIFLRLKHVLPQYLDRFIEDFRVGDFVFHAVSQNLDRDPIAWEATEVEIFSREENEKLQRGESLDLEPELEPAPLVAAPELTQESVLAAHKRKKTLLQLISEQRMNENGNSKEIIVGS